MLNLQNAGLNPLQEYNEITDRFFRNLRKSEHENLVCHQISTFVAGLCLFLPCSIFLFSSVIKAIVMNRPNVHEIIIGYICIAIPFVIFIISMVESYKATKQLKSERNTNLGDR